MGQFRINIAAPNLVNICIDCVKDGEYSGRIFHKYFDKEIPFHESGHMISILDQFYNRINYPQASTKYRSFKKRKKGEPDLPARYQEEAKPVWTADEMLKPRGKEATFILHVQYRQNSTWQGKLIWMEEEDEETFSSVLEILKLLDSALERE